MSTNREDFVTLEKHGDVTVMTLDAKKESMNIVSPTTMELLGEVFEELQNDDSVKAVVIISGKKDFIAGADIKAFAIEKKGDFEPVQKRGHEMLMKLRNGKKPVVAAIHGAGVGLGTELPLACHARIASSSPKTFMGLPEVKIGLLPGGAGTQLLPRLVGLQAALDMILTGKNIYAYRAKKMGLVDDVVEPDKLKRAAIMMAERLLQKPMVRKRKKSLVNKFLENTGVGRNIVLKQAGKMAMKQSQGNYPAIPAILDCIGTGVQKGLEAGLDKEREHFEALMLTDESKALRSLFFATTENKKNPFGKTEREINTLGMIGAGFMGAGIAEVSVTKGVNVLLKDIATKTLEEAQKQIWKSLQKKVKYRALSKPQAETQMANLQPQLDYRAYDQADMVIEAVLEKMELKKVIIKEIEEHCKEDVIIASNTSSLSLTEMASAAKKPENVIGMHYFSPVPKMPLLEIVTTEHTNQEVIAACYNFGLKQGKTVIVVKDGPGFYVNRILAPYLNECLLLVNEGAAFDVVDKALIKHGFPVGPITLLDQVGLDISAHVTEVTRPLFEPREGFKTTPAVTKMYEAGRLGRKNGQGFYSYDPKTKKRKGPDSSAYTFFEGNGDKTISMQDMQNRAVLTMLNEAVMCLEEGIISNPTDGDLGAVFGIGFLPFRGGPFRYIDSWGADKVVAEMERLEAEHGARFTPRPLLKEKAQKGEKFHA